MQSYNNVMNNQKLYPNNNDFIYDDSEGGINIGEIKNILVRNLFLIIGGTFAFTALGYLKVLSIPPFYKSSIEILSEPLSIETVITSATYSERSTQTKEKITDIQLDDVQLKLLKSPQVIEGAVDELKDQYPLITYSAINEGLNLKILSQAQDRNVLLVEYQHPNKQQVSDVIDSLRKLYINYSLEKRQSALKLGIAFLDKQIPKVKSEITNIENQISKLKSTHNFIEPEISYQQVNNQINNLSQQKGNLAIESQQLQLKSRNFEQEFTSQSVNSTTALELATPRYLQLLDQLQNVDVEIARKSVIFLDKSVEIQTLEQEKQEIIDLIVGERGAIKQKLDNQINSLELRQQSIAKEITRNKLQLKKWSVVFKDYDHLKETLNIANNKLNSFVLQKDVLLTDLARQEAPWQLLSPAKEAQIDNISKINYLLVSFSLGLLISIGAALFIDRIKDIIYTTDKLQKIAGNIPILSIIPYIQQIKEPSFLQVINSTQKTKQLEQRKRALPEKLSASMEIFRSLAATLNLLNPNYNLESTDNKNLKSIVITSSTFREGKSVVALGLANACASLGKKTLLVDTDLRNIDCLTRSLGYELEIGLKNILYHNNNSLKHIKQLPWEKNLYILPSGFDELQYADVSKLDPSRLLASEKMPLLMEELKKQYDVVIYDLCDLNSFIDIDLLADNTDGILLVTGLGKIKSTALTESLNKLRLYKVPILGIVINKLTGN